MTLRTSLAHTLPALRADPELLMFAKILPAQLRWPCEKLFDTTILTNLSKMVEVPVSLQGGTSSVTKLLILSDSHNSPDVVQRILRDETDVDALIFLGDGLRDLEQGLTQHPGCGPMLWPATAITARWSRWTAWPLLIRPWFFIPTGICTG